MYAHIKNIRRITQTKYPRFAFGLEVSTDEIPIFTFHDVESKNFEQDVCFLLGNEYQPLSLQEFDVSDRNCQRRSVLLTFDDARRSFYNVAFPILRKYQIHATLFVPTYWVGKSVNERGRKFGFMNWRQLREVADSGLVDVQSHGHRHTLINTSDKLVAFVESKLVDVCDIFDWPMHRIDDEHQHGIPPLGTPVYRAAPLLSCDQKAFESSHVNELCRDFVKMNGGPIFFMSPDWRKKLRAIMKSASAQVPNELINIRELQDEEFSVPLRLFEEHLGYAPTHFAYPWMLGTEETLDLAVDHGIRAVFGVGIDFGKYDSRKRPRIYGRYKSDWLKLLPGRGRDSLIRIIGNKLAGGGTGHLAH